jgi:hypothetical protein
MVQSFEGSFPALFSISTSIGGAVKHRIAALETVNKHVTPQIS